MMEKSANLEHWERWAAEYGTELLATTKCMSIKRLEVESLLRRIATYEVEAAPLILEVGCGNGANGLALASRHPKLEYIGLDFSPAMITNATHTVARGTTQGERTLDRLAFGVADARHLALPLTVDATQPHYAGSLVAKRMPSDRVDIIFTDRMLINLSSAEEQLAVMERIAKMLRPGGLFLMIENSVQTHRVLNEIRITLGLPARPPADYNVFIDELRVIKPFERLMNLVAIDDFGSLHDLMLYAVAPSLSGGEVQYDTPLMTRLTDAILSLADRNLGAQGFGQNRLWVWRK